MAIVHADAVVIGPGDRLLGRYEVTEVIGGGGESLVLGGRDRVTGEEVALKVWPGEAARTGRAHLAELSVLLDFNHPGVVRVREADIDPTFDVPVMVMDRVQGVDLSAHCSVQSGGCVEQLDFLALQIIEALACLHRGGILHGDLKPQNIVVSDRDDQQRCVLIDFGMASRRSSEIFKGGTPAYLAPEIVSGHPPDQRSDIYSLGLTLLQAALGEAAPRRSMPRKLTCGPILSRLLPRMLTRSPDGRYADALAALSAARGAAGEDGPLVLPERLPLVGRDAALQRLVDAGLALSLGRAAPALATVAGAAGMGKRRLTEEALSRLRAAGCRVVSWSADQDLRIFVESLLSTLGVSIAESSRALESVFARSAAATAGPQPVVSEGRRAAALVSQHARTAHLICGGPAPREDQVEWVDFLTGILRQEEAERSLGHPPRIVILLAGTPVWSGPPGADPILHLKPMTEAATCRLLIETSGADESSPSPRAAAIVIHELTGGWPLLLEELLRRAVSEGAIWREGEGIAFDADHLRAMRLPRDLEEVLDRRFRDLDAIRRTVVSALAVLRRPVSLVELAGAIGGDERELSSALMVLGEQGFVVRSRGLRGPLHSLTGNEVRRFLESRLDRESERALHRSWAQVLSGSEQVLHMLGAGEGVPGDRILEGVRQLASDGENRRALHLADLAEETSRLTSKDRPRLRLEVARCLLALGRTVEAEECFADLEDSAEVVVASGAARHGAEIAQARGDSSEALQRARRALDLAGDHPLQRSRCLAVLALLGLRSGALEEATVAADEAAALAPASSREMGAARNVQALLMFRGGNAAAAATVFEAVTEMLLAQDDRIGAAVVGINHGAALFRSGSPREASAILLNAAQVFAEGGHVRLQAQALTNLGVIRNHRGQHRDGAASQREARRLALGCGELPMAALARANEGLAHLDGGQPHKAHLALSEALRSLQPGTRPEILARAHLSRAAVLRGRRRTARREALTAFQAARRLGTSREISEASLAAGCSASSQEDGQRWFERARRNAEQSGEAALAREASLLAAESVVAAGDLAAARRHLKQAGPMDHDDLPALIIEARLASPDAAPRLVARGLRLSRGGGHLLGHMRLCHLAASLSLDAGRDTRALSFYRKARRDLLDLEEGMTQRGSALLELTVAAKDLRELAQATEVRLATLGRQRDSSLALEVSEVLGLLRELNSEQSMKRLLERVVDSALKLTQAVRGFVVLRGEKDQLRFAASRSESGESVPTPRSNISTSIVYEVMATGRSLVVVDALDDDRYSGLLSVADQQIRSLACVPLTAGGIRLGALYLDAGELTGAFAEMELPLIEAFADVAALAIRNLQRRSADHSERTRLSRELESQRVSVRSNLAEISRMRAAAGVGTLIGKSRPIDRINLLIDRFAATDLGVVVTGASGTGKEVVARAIHDRSERQPGPFITQNCAAIPANLFESELFGHVKGAFTGALQDSPGLFVLASGGTLFLDEVGELPAEFQARLLRVLEEGRVRPLGADKPVSFDTRIVAATNSDLRQRVEEGTFRADLWFRLAAVEIAVPPLNERAEDIPLLCRHFLQSSGSTARITPAALRILVGHDWPGNVRQLKNEIERAAVLCEDERIDPGDFSPDIRGAAPQRMTLVGGDGSPLPLQEVERLAIAHALDHAGQDRRKTAKLLGISRSSLYDKIKRYDLA